MDWHRQMFGSIYRECGDAADLSDRAREAAGRLLVHQDTSDYSRPRPQPCEPLYSTWADLSREEMCAYYWATINDLCMDELAKLPEQAWTDISYTNVTAENVMRIAEFCGLRGLTESTVQAMLGRRINSLKNREAGEAVYSRWTDWDSGQRDRFDAIASKTMHRLGYYEPGSEWKPPSYGQWWASHDGGLEWYTWMFNTRKRVHDAMIAWVRQREQAGESLARVADFGCGLGVGYSDVFADKEYWGVDIAETNILWCRKHRGNLKHRYLLQDFIVEPLKEKADLVFSSGTLDNAYDIDHALKTMVASSRRWVYVTFYRGWFPGLNEHRYAWSGEHTCMYADASPARLQRKMLEFGCRDVQVFPIKTGRSDVPHETVLITRVPATAPAKELHE